MSAADAWARHSGDAWNAKPLEEKVDTLAKDMDWILKRIMRGEGGLVELMRPVSSDVERLKERMRDAEMKINLLEEENRRRNDESRRMRSMGI